MIKKHSILISFLLCATLLCSALTACGSHDAYSKIIADERHSYTPLAVSTDDEFYYGRYALSLMDNSTALLYAYDKITDGIEKSYDEISVYNGTSKISKEEIETVFDAYRRDHAEHFWLGSTYTMTHNSQTILKIKPTYIMSGAVLENARLEVENAVTSILSEIDASMSDYEKELILHDKLAARISYVDTDNAYNLYGALIEGKAVCEGYTEAFQYLLHKVGIRSFMILGVSKNPSSSGEYESHAWNAVQIDGSYYHVDLTWDDQDEYLFHAYFNLTDTVIKSDHEITETEYPLPVCNTDSANYFKKSGAYLTDYTVNSVAALLKSNNLSVSVYLPSNVNAFITWFNNNISDIATKAGVYSTFTYGYVSIGNEVQLKINKCKHLLLIPVNAVEATCTHGGNIKYYICNSCEKLFSDSTATNEIQNIYSVQIDQLPHTYTEWQSNSTHHWHGCSVCEGEELDKAMHSYSADCDSSCDICEEIRQANHTFGSEYKSDNKNHWHECECGEKSDVNSHTDNDNDKICDECNADIKKSDIDLSPLKGMFDKLIKGSAAFLVAFAGFTALVCIIIRIFSRKKQ